MKVKRPPASRNKSGLADEVISPTEHPGIIGEAPRGRSVNEVPTSGAKASSSGGCLPFLARRTLHSTPPSQGEASLSPYERIEIYRQLNATQGQ